jgi:hypothetical protein
MTVNNRKLLGQVGIAIFILGIVTAIIYQCLLLWGTIEAGHFDRGDPALLAGEKLNSLRCPRIITRGETAMVSADFTNPTDSDRIRLIRTNISDGFITMRREITTNLSLEPGETQTVTWEVSSDDAVWNRLIFVRVYALRTTAQMPAQSNTCSILVLEVPGVKGSHIANLLLALSVLGPALGLGLWGRLYWPWVEDDRDRASKMGVAAILVWLGLYMGLAGFWIGHLVILVFLIFMAATMVTRKSVSSVESM